ncbi:bacteriohemerythrin [Terasakiella sp. A23]|uniref:GGDEF domain-containing protein n=1 Tax=Terasakiella sp. FCG-A23 TaxID=3080561 RepID=UPI00295458ED|nr:bacteriohemerythrin [Terasakiella sp. A23]MDV7341106.1 bacteriohemerythrin [Terasakiella sp. A23]
MSQDKFEVFPWNDNFNTGHKEIDEQHRKLVSLLNELATTLINNQTMDVSKAFDDLAKYADFHFAAEEEIWRKFFDDDSWLHSHQLTHSSFLPKVLEIQKNGKDKPLHDLIEEIIQFLIRWLIFHIIDDDKRLAIVVESMEKGHDLIKAKQIADRKMNGSVRVLIDAVLTMYDGLSNRTLGLLRERKARMEAEEKLREANEKLEKLSYIDQLTQLYNRRHFDDIFARELKRARRKKTMLTLMMLDVDYFKRLNDKYGHPEGDVALKKVAQEIKRCCKRASDFCFRIGGEEFAILTNSSNSEEQVRLAETIRQNIENLQIPNEDSDVSDFATVTIGLVSVIPDQDTTEDGMMKIADGRLYAAKRNKRNTVLAEGERGI